ncbi:MAG: hypothetical protein EOO38_10640 [Cytophagaceae bacterium]|nr:MAG: hypothetical protein EOO38_10640 [Cytophagaceae bacterium]
MCVMPFAPRTEVSNSRVLVIASSIEGINALARLVNQLPSAFPLPIVVQVRGLKDQSINRLLNQELQSASKMKVSYALDGQHVSAGCIYVIPADEGLVFTAQDVLSRASGASNSNVDDLFKSAALWYGSNVIGVVLSGIGTDGTIGLQAITNSQGIRVVQSPSEAAFSSMPSSALHGDHVQHSVMLDQMGALLEALVSQPDPTEALSSKVQLESMRLLSSSKEDRQKSLDRSIVDILAVMRVELVMDIVFVSKEAGDAVIVTHSTSAPGILDLQGMSNSKKKSLCQYVLDGRLPPVMPDVAKLRLTQEVPITSTSPGSYMAAPIWLQGGSLYGTLCCLNLAASPELGQRHYQRLQMSARQIARLVNEAGEK